MRLGASCAVVITCALLGCATTPVTVANSRLVEPDRVLGFNIQTEVRSAHIVVIRDDGFIGSGCYYAIHINGELAARLAPTERVDFYVAPGEILFRVGRDPLGRGLCAVGKDNWTQRETTVKAGETKFYRMTLDANGKCDIFRSDS